MRRLRSIDEKRLTWALIAEKRLPWLLIAAIALFWQLVVDLGWVRRFILPSPTDIVGALVDQWPIILPHLGVTLAEGLAGLAVSILFSLVMAVLMDAVRGIRKAVYPLLVMSQTVPIIVIAPLIAMWFGFGIEPKIFIVVLVCFFPVTINLMEGMQSVDRELIDLMRAMGARPLQIFTKIKLPYTLPYLFSGLKIAVTYSIMGAVIGEWLGGSAGLGVYMERARHSFALDRVFASIFLIMAVSIALFRGVSFLQNRIMPWTRTEEETS